MILLFIIVIVYYVGKGINEFITPPLPPISDTTAHLQAISNLPDERARQQYLMKLRKAGISK